MMVICDIVRAVGDHRPVSAMGEWADGNLTIPDVGLTYVKWARASCKRKLNWRRRTSPQQVLVAYADWQCASAPPIEEVFYVATQNPGSVMLVDTHCKDANNVVRKVRPTLLDWLPRDWIFDLCERARDANVRIALAGSLGANEIEELLPASPDWFAVRGAVCESSERNAIVQVERVRKLVKLLKLAG